jgi:hypothetical protein
MSRTASKEALEFAERLEKASAPTAALPPSNSDLQKRVNDLEQQLETLRPKESPLAKMTREQDEYLKRFEEEKKRKQDEDARALEQARDAERLRQASLPQSPSTEQLVELVDALSEILNGDFYGSSRARDQEVDVWPRWNALVDALEAATASPINGWTPDVVKALKLATEAVEGLARSWGLFWSLRIGRAAREAQAAAKIEAWKKRWDLADKCDALLWVAAYEKGEAPRPDRDLLSLATLAKVEGIPTPSLPPNRLPAGTRAPRELENGGIIPALVALTAKQKRACPALGTAHPKLSNESRYELSDILQRLRQGLPYAHGPSLSGLIMNGQVVLPHSGVVSDPRTGVSYYEDKETGKWVSNCR